MPIEHTYRDRWQTSIRELWDQDRAGRSTETFDRLLAVLEERDRDLEEHLRATTSTTDWIEPTLINSWANFGSGYQEAEFQRVGGRTFLRGLIAAGTINTVAFVLPEGFRPPARLVIVVNANAAFGLLDIRTNGEVVPNVGSTTSFSIDCDFSTVAR